MTSYQQLMEYVRVDDAMASRVLAGVASSLDESARELPAQPAHVANRPSSRHLRLVPTVMVAAAAAAVLVLAIVLPLAQDAPGTGKAPTTTEEPAPDLAIPGFVEYGSAQVLSEAVGFTVPELTELPFAVSETRYESIDDNLAQVSYTAADQEVVLRMGPGSEDVSGDYTDYAQAETLEIEGVTVTIKGDGNLWQLATWLDDGYSYAISCDSGISKDELCALVGQVL